MSRFKVIATVSHYGEPLKLSVGKAPELPDEPDATTFMISYATADDSGDWVVIEQNAEMYRDVNAALKAFQLRAVTDEPWLRASSRYVNMELQNGQSVSVPVDGLELFTNAIYPRYDVDRHPECYTLAMFALQTYSAAFDLGKLVYPSDPTGIAEELRIEAVEVDDKASVTMDIVRNPAAAFTGQPGRLIRVEYMTAEGVAEGTEYFHDIDMASTAFNGRVGEYPEMPSGFGMRLDVDGGRSELKDEIASKICVSLPIKAVEQIIRLIDRNHLTGLDGFRGTIEDVLQRTHDAGELAVAAMSA